MSSAPNASAVERAREIVSQCQHGVIALAGPTACAACIARALDAILTRQERPLCADFGMGAPCLNLAERGDYCAEHAPTPPAEVEAALTQWGRRASLKIALTPEQGSDLLATVTALVDAAVARILSAHKKAEDPTRTDERTP